MRCIECLHGDLFRNMLCVWCLYMSTVALNCVYVCTVALNFHYGWRSYVLCKLMNTWHVYIARMSLTLNGSSALQPSNGVKRLNMLRKKWFLPGTTTYSICRTYSVCLFDSYLMQPCAAYRQEVTCLLNQLYMYFPVWAVWTKISEEKWDYRIYSNRMVDPI